MPYYRGPGFITLWHFSSHTYIVKLNMRDYYVVIKWHDALMKYV